jgi:hypothetical protein
VESLILRRACRFGIDAMPARTGSPFLVVKKCMMIVLRMTHSVGFDTTCNVPRTFRNTHILHNVIAFIANKRLVQTIYTDAQKYPNAFSNVIF